jgi:hypothetical protein
MQRAGNAFHFVAVDIFTGAAKSYGSALFWIPWQPLAIGLALLVVLCVFSLFIEREDKNTGRNTNCRHEENKAKLTYGEGIK